MFVHVKYHLTFLFYPPPHLQSLSCTCTKHLLVTCNMCLWHMAFVITHVRFIRNRVVSRCVPYRTVHGFLPKTCFYVQSMRNLSRWQALFTMCHANLWHVKPSIICDMDVAYEKFSTWVRCILLILATSTSLPK
jgi:hypothetical protein